MIIEMVRIDDRLIHGQVIAGWCPVLKPDRLILCNDEVAQSEWERDIYASATEDFAVSILTVDQTARMVLSDEHPGEKVFIVVETPKDGVRLLGLGLTIAKMIVGGMHYQPGKRKVCDFIYVDDEDIADFRTLFTRGVNVEARDVPSCKSLDIFVALGLDHS